MCYKLIFKYDDYVIHSKHYCISYQPKYNFNTYLFKNLEYESKCCQKLKLY